MKEYLPIAITGHIDLLEADKPFILEKIKKLFGELRQEHQKPLKLYSALAPGADTWAAECLEGDDKLLYVEPLPDDMYKKYTFGGKDVEKSPKKEGYNSDEQWEKAHEKYKAQLAVYEAKIKAFEKFKPNETVPTHKDPLADYDTADVRLKAYSELGNYLVTEADVLIALWDGVDGGGEGGTSDVVKKWIKGRGQNGEKITLKKTKRTLYHLPVKRSKNLRPVERFFTNDAQRDIPKGDWILHEFTPHRKSRRDYFIEKWNEFKYWILTAFCIFIPLIVKNWFVNPGSTEDWLALLGLFGLYVIAAFSYKGFAKSYSELLLRFIFPLSLAFLVLGIGTYGYHQTKTMALGDSFFTSANLITLNTSVFNDDPKDSSKNDPKDAVTPPNLYIKTARILGGFLAGYAFLLAFALAVGKENISRLTFWLYRVRPFWKQGYYIVVGDGERALSLAYDLSNCNRQFVFFDASKDNVLKEALEDIDCWYFRGNPWSKTNLAKLHIDNARKVFILCEDDENNFRAIQEMDDISSKNTDNAVDWFVHFNDMGFRDSIHKILDRRSSQLHTFCTEAVAAMRALKQYPVYRRYDEEFKTFHVAIAGFNRQGQELLFELCQTSHFKIDQTTHIHIYYRKEEKDTVEAFRDKYPVLDQENHYRNVFKGEEKEVADYTFSRIKIRFIPLPESELALRDPDFDLYSFLNPASANTLYICIDKGMKNAEILKIVLPVLYYQKIRDQRDIRVFSYYNYPDKEEQEYIETKLNALAPNIPVFCFGNMLDECRLESIENKEDMALAKRIALIYHLLYDNLKVDEKAALETISPIKEKIQELGKSYKNKPDIEEYEKSLKNHLGNFFHRMYALPNYDTTVDKNWSSIDEIDRLSNIRAANHAHLKHLLYERYSKEQKSMPWGENELKALSETEHRRWNAEKLLTGWRPYFDPEAWTNYKANLRAQKYHNFLVNYDELPPVEQSKDWVQVMGVVG